MKSRNMRAKGKRRNNMPQAIRRELSDGPAYSGQQVAVLKLEGIPSLLTTSGAGLINTVISLDITAVLGFATRFGSTFDEYRILATKCRITPVSAGSGVSKMWFDEKSAAAPTLNESQERTSQPLANTNTLTSAKRTMAWRARDLLDLQYTPIGTTVTPVYFKVYTNAANWGAVINQPTWIVEPVFTVEFRGLKST
jgi:hypothetical protein